MKHKVGDKVKIKSLDWYNANKDKDGIVHTFVHFLYPMSYQCGKIAIIKQVDNKGRYKIDLDEYYIWTDDMFDENFKDMETKEIIIPDGWEVEKVEGNKVILKKSKKELPKTWEGCYKLLGKGEFIKDGLGAIKGELITPALENRHFIPVGLGRPLLALCQLLVCRDVYRGSWKPNWENKTEYKYCIHVSEGNIITNCFSNHARVLSFQSMEVRDQFLENFRDLIEEAKELI